VKTVREFQEELLDGAAMRVKTDKINVQAMFKQEDREGKGMVLVQTFQIALQRAFQVKDIDARLVAMRFLERGGPRGGTEVNYSKFLADLDQRVKLGNLNQASSGQPNLFGAGMNDSSMSSDIA
jgi:hypothetical protein